uniref:Uncharacterized protein n=1 Tax=Panagrellus redivivus TaxID=6233 RepID=A0A7E4VFV2_PANRE
MATCCRQHYLSELRNAARAKKTKTKVERSEAKKNAVEDETLLKSRKMARKTSPSSGAVMFFVWLNNSRQPGRHSCVSSFLLSFIFHGDLTETTCIPSTGHA